MRKLVDWLIKRRKKQLHIPIEKLKTSRLCFVKKEVSIGCATCEYKQLSMNDKPCLNCIGRYSEWKQQIGNQ